MSYRLRIAALGTNELGNTLTLLTRDLFHTLGYEDCRFDVHKTGRELDVVASHRYEKRMLVAECKATQDPIGGADINKFVGALDAERRRHSPVPVHGYFVSLSGFRQSAIEQEKELGEERVTLITGEDIVARLADSAVVVAPEVAIENAARCAAAVPGHLRVLKVELVGHVGGWMWLIQFGADFDPTHMCFVHADGRVLPETAIATLRYTLPQLELLPPTPVVQPPDLDLGYYKSYVLREYGAITLEGMPADHEVGSRSFQLEGLYVPLGLKPLIQPADGLSSRPDTTGRISQLQPVHSTHIGGVLSDQSRVAVLGPPGAGKTTVLKRLAIAYADPHRSRDPGDSLPDQDWLPIFIKCRHLTGGSAHKPITEMIGDLMVRAELPEKRRDFLEAVAHLLREGKVLLLVDGLDEISDTGERVSFVSQLRTFLARYPSIRVVITSREVGYRAVAGAVTSICTPYRIAELSRPGIRQLVEAWHREVLGERPDVQREAADLANSILMSNRIVRLAVNPLLLTTLLLVKRWVGQLPRKRTVLYQKAVEVLLMTWNVEGHEPIDQDEALPQLAYAAFCMMESGRTRVSSKDLTSLFHEARSAMQEIFAYTRKSVNDFIQRVEERSSLLVLSGHEVIDGALQPIYEFKHLTFQEYLTSLAITNGWVPEDKRDTSPAELLRPHLGSESWREVIALTSVLIGRRAARLIELLTTLLKEAADVDAVSDERADALQECLIDCLYDEASVTPELARSALQVIIERSPRHEVFVSPLLRLLETRLADTLRETVNDAIRSNKKPLRNYGNMLMEIATADLTTEQAGHVHTHIATKMRDGDLIEQCAAAGVLSHAAYLVETGNDTPYDYGLLHNADLTTADIAVATKAAAERFAAGLPEAASLIFTWALVWCTAAIRQDAELSATIMVRALDDWLSSDDPDVNHFSSWLVGNLVETHGWHTRVDKGDVFPKMTAKWRAIRDLPVPVQDTERQRFALMAAAYFLGGPWSGSAIIDMVETTVRQGVKKPEDFTLLLSLHGVADPEEFMRRASSNVDPYRTRHSLLPVKPEGTF